MNMLCVYSVLLLSKPNCEATRFTLQCSVLIYKENRNFTPMSDEPVIPYNM